MLKRPTAIPQCKKPTVRKELSVACITNKFLISTIHKNSQESIRKRQKLHLKEKWIDDMNGHLKEKKRNMNSQLTKKI